MYSTQCSAVLCSVNEHPSPPHLITAPVRLSPHYSPSATIASLQPQCDHSAHLQGSRLVRRWHNPIMHPASHARIPQAGHMEGHGMPPPTGASRGSLRIPASHTGRIMGRHTGRDTGRHTGRVMGLHAWNICWGEICR